jgi:hypothetical protein
VPFWLGPCPLDKRSLSHQKGVFADATPSTTRRY